MDFTALFDGIATGLKAKLAEKVTGRRLLAYHTVRLGRDVFAREKPVVWVNVSVPFEIVGAFPVASTYAEFVGAVLAGKDAAEPFLLRAEAAGFPRDGCSYHRALLGAVIEDLVTPPIAVVAATCPCDGGLKTVAEVGRRASAPALFLNVPERATPESVRYLAAQLEEMVRFLERVTGTAFDRDAFRETIARSNETARILKEVYAFGGKVPAPYDAGDLKNFQIVMLPLMGTDEGIQVARQFRDEFAARAASGAGGIDPERLRLMWIQNRIQFPNGILDHLRDRFGANVVWDELNEVYWDEIDPDDPFPGLAIRLIDSPLGGDGARRMGLLKQRAADYRIDGAIHPSNWGCRQSQNARGLFASALKEVGVPMISLDVDCVDRRSFAEGQLTTRLEAFCEMLLERKGA
jgi:benzoyl-CoA reductase/2-hydroxyglutaryl-CoA dehydratase subunit BcrC/BadD/HgdB